MTGATGGSTEAPAFSLRRLAHAEPTNALLLLEPDARRILSLRARAGDAVVYLVAGGALLVGDVLGTTLVPGALRLRRVVPDVPIFVPVDAELVPALLPNEALARTVQRGLVFLPGSAPLAFSLAKPLTPTALVKVGETIRREWAPLPEPPVLAGRLTGIRVELPPEAPDAVLEAGKPRDPAAPDAAQPGAKDRARMGLGRALFKAGEALGIDKLKRAGAELIDSAVSNVPSLGEGILGRQEAALRDLLNKLRSGKIEEALRRALPLPEPGSGRGARASSSAQLPTHDIRYSLENVLGKSGAGGGASVWFGGFDVQKELAAEYRKAAEKAVADGDHRRAAFIYGKLLRDYRRAAGVLARAGLHRDAAILYLTKCDDKLSAAREFQAAGEIDRAVELYREKGEHILAGDLLRASGDEERALVEFQTAATLLARREEWLAAAELLSGRALRPDLAIACLEDGWSRRASRPTFVCGTKLLDLCAKTGKTERILPLVGEAEALLRGPGREAEATSFWTAAALLHRSAPLAPALQEELRDRARLGLAFKLSQRAEWDTRPARVVQEILGPSDAWSRGVTADAQVAVAGAIKGRRARAREVVARVKVANGPVTSVCAASAPGLVFLGLENGEVHRFRAEDRSTQRLTVHHPPVVALACDPTGKLVIAARAGLSCELVSYSRRDEVYYRIEKLEVSAEDPVVLSNVTDPEQSIAHIAVWDGTRRSVLDCPQLRPSGIGLPPLDEEPAALCFADVQPQPLAFVADRVRFGHATIFLGWTPEIPRGVSLRSAPLSTWPRDDHSLEVVGLSEAGVISWGEIPLDRRSEHAGVAHRAAGYLAATLYGPGKIAAVTSSAVEWLQVGSHEIERTGTTPVEGIQDAIACFVLDTTREVAVVTASGAVVCARLPGA